MGVFVFLSGIAIGRRGRRKTNEAVAGLPCCHHWQSNLNESHSEVWICAGRGGGIARDSAPWCISHARVGWLGVAATDAYTYVLLIFCHILYVRVLNDR